MRFGCCSLSASYPRFVGGLLDSGSDGLGNSLDHIKNIMGTSMEALTVGAAPAEIWRALPASALP